MKALGLNAQGQIYPPRRTTMWYSGSAQPGQNGIAVIAGHVTYDGPDNFYNLTKVAAAAPLRITCSSGRQIDAVVTRTASVPKTTLQTDQTVWGSSPSPVVVLITCDPASRVVKGHHLNNFVVWTVPR
ncbi:class F sortase [Allobranchiibius sp. GilTou38]|nr:class F sortase [Allobranchiibius sp. GilTou38]